MHQLADGRRLGFAEYGDPAGPVPLYFHGHPGSRLEARFVAEAAVRAGVRLIGVDRPGLGLSDYQPRRRVTDWPDDVVQLVNQLRLQRVAVLGYSGGAPYALVCANRLADRVTAGAIVSGASEVGLLIRMLARWMPWLLLHLTRRRFADNAQARRSLQRIVRRWPEPDQQAYGQPGVPDVLADSLAEAFRQGVKGAARDGSLLGRPRNIPLEKLTQPVQVWHGEQDTQVPAAAARVLADQLPHATIEFCPNDGHISTIVDHADAIVTTLMSY